MGTGLAWCAEGADQATCHRYHTWGKLPPGPGRGKDRECPVCQSNLSINPGDRGMWLVWCCQGGCDRRIVRLALEQARNIPAACLGSYGSGDWEDRQQHQRAASRPDPATAAAASRSYAFAKLVGADISNMSLLKMCMQAISESDGNVAADPDHLLPREYKAFVALARRTGIERCHAAKLARSWLTR